MENHINQSQSQSTDILKVKSSFKKILWPLFIPLTFFLSGSGLEPQHTADIQPNILWIYLEDTAPLMGCYGTEGVNTPHIDKLAAQGLLFTNVIMPSPVCSASRSSIITGTMSTTTGTHNHHSSRSKESAIYLPDEHKTIPELFRQAGYFTFNEGKDDYNFIYDRRDLYDQEYRYHPLYGKSGDEIDLASLQPEQPFFGQIQLRGGKEIFSRDFKEKIQGPVDRKTIELPPYLPHHPVIVEEYANHLDAIQITDQKVGKIMEDLESSGLLEQTVVFFFSDHGMRLTRNKQFLYDGGLRVPLIIADFRKTGRLLASGVVNNELIAGLDLGSSSLGLAGIPLPENMEGRNFFDPNSKPREFVVSTRDRCDFTIDRIRSISSDTFKYIRNFKTDRPYTQLTYMDVNEVEFVRVMKQLYAEGGLNQAQSRFMSDIRPAEELYDLQADPYELHNLAGMSEYAEVLQTYRSLLTEWIQQTDDQGQYPEPEAGLRFMLGIWGENCVNPEYDKLRREDPDFPGSLSHLKSQAAIPVEPDIKGSPVFSEEASQIVILPL